MNRLRRGLPPTTASYLLKVREDADEDAMDILRETDVQGVPPADASNPSQDRQTHEADHHPHPHEGQAIAIFESIAGHHHSSSWPSVSNQGGTDVASRDDDGSLETMPSASSSWQRPRPRHVDHHHLHHAAADSPSGLLGLGVADGLRPRPRRRITGKQSVPGEGDGNSRRAALSLSCARPDPSTAWSRRIGVTKLPVPTKCNVCDRMTRTTCSGCLAPLCLFCAKSRQRCPASDMRELVL